jgi:hypothetical protein
LETHAFLYYVIAWHYGHAIATHLKSGTSMKTVLILVTSIALIAVSHRTFAADCPLAANPSGNLLTNPGIEFCGIDGAGDDAIPFGWQMDESIVQTPQNGNETLAEGAFYGHRRYQGDGGNDIGRYWNMWFKPYVGTFTEIAGVKQEDNFAHLFQTVAGTAGKRYTMTGFAAAETHFAGGVTNLNWATGDPGSPSPDPNNFTDGRLSPTDAFFTLEFLNASNVVLDFEQIELKEAGLVNNSVANWTNAVWTQFTVTGIAPAGTTQVRVKASLIDGVANIGADPQSLFVDAFSLIAEDVVGTPGDFDLDGDVDGRDFLVWQRNPSVGSLADWQGNYGTGSLTATAAVPEPNSLAVLSLALCGLLALGRKSVSLMSR